MTPIPSIASACARILNWFGCGSGPGRTFRPLLAGLLVSALAGLRLHAQEKPFLDREVKANMLPQIARFVEWPNQAFAREASPIVIGVLGDDPFGTALDKAVKNKTAHDRPLEVKRFKDARGIESCHILFISRSETRRLPEILAALKNAHVLTVGDMDGFAQRGVTINFYKDGKQVGLEGNIAAAVRAGLKLRAQFRRLLKEVD